MEQWLAHLPPPSYSGEPFVSSDRPARVVLVSEEEALNQPVSVGSYSHPEGFISRTLHGGKTSQLWKTHLQPCPLHTPTSPGLIHTPPTLPPCRQVHCTSRLHCFLCASISQLFSWEKHGDGRNSLRRGELYKMKSKQKIEKSQDEAKTMES